MLRFIAQGLTGAAAAARADEEPRTIGTHLTSIDGKLGVSSRTAATRLAVERGLV